MTKGVEIITEVLVLPPGLPPDHYDVNAFGVHVRWKGVQNDKKSMGGYSVEHVRANLTKGGKWIYPQPFQYHLCRWDTLEEALEAAHSIVGTIRAGGRTWAEAQGQR